MTLSKFSYALLCGTACLTLLTACNLRPDLHMPDVANPQSFKEDTHELDGKWAAASANPGQVDVSDWWTIFNDPALNELEAQAKANNQNLQAAAARIKQADATYRQARASLLPAINLGGNAGRGNFPYGGKPITNYQIQTNLAYEVDLFGRIRNQTDIARLNAEAQQDLYNQSLLLIHAQVAQSYYALKALDTERDLLRQTITLRENAAKLIKSRFDLGETGEQDYLRAQNELASAQADLTALDRQRAITEHALSILIGKAPSETTIAQTKLPQQLPLIPAGLPSSILERRPDIAVAQKQIASANAQIGVARAAFFPVLNLTAAAGLSSPELGDVFSWSSRSWMLGPLFGTALSVPLFDGGRRVAGVDLAKAGYEERVATYRQQVLVAFGEVEDALVSLNTEAQQAEQLYRAADASTKANHLSDLRYKEGESSYLEVIETQRDALAAQRAYTRVQGQRFVDTVTLIRALGGGWPQAATGNTQAPAAQATPVVKPVVQEPNATAPAPDLAKNAPATGAEEAAPTPTLPQAPVEQPVLPPQSAVPAAEPQAIAVPLPKRQVLARSSALPLDHLPPMRR